MCGISLLIKRSTKIDQNKFKEITRLLSRRGPDDEGFLFEEKIALGHRRLSIIDLKTGHQPMSNENEMIYIVFNGEIYNYRALIDKLLTQGHIFKTKSDTEALLHLYEEHNYRLSEYIEGMFSFAIFDKNENAVTFSRDQFGKKPLYYYHDQDIFAMASEMKVLLDIPEIRKNIKIDKISLMKYLSYGYVPSPHSIFDNIYKLEPSHTAQFDISNWKIVNKYSYWNILKSNASNEYRDEDKVLKKLDLLLTNAVKKRIVADVPVGAFLSGGVDSSIVCAKIMELNPNLQMFNISYDDASVDESEYAKDVAKWIKSESNFLKFNFTDDLVLSSFIEILDYMDEPIADAAIIPTYLLSKFAKDYVKVILSGDGGDELFGGYSKYKAQVTADNISKITPKALMRAISGFSAQLLTNISYPTPLEPYLKFLSSLHYDLEIRNFIWGSGGFHPEELKKLLNLKKIDANEIFSDALEYGKLARQLGVLNRCLYLDCKIQLPDWYLVKTDRATMANSLEMRNPLLDKDLAEFMFSVSDHEKMKNGESKYLLKLLASNYIPRHILYRKKKGFGVPLGRWMKTILKDFIEEVLNYEELVIYFDKSYVIKLWDDHINGKRDNTFKILRIVNFLYFINRYNCGR
ncbi:MAG: asparagine synthase (glutamine-hydrolyzing) [Methanothrix sp.]